MNKDASFILHWHHQTNDLQPGSGDNIMTRNYSMTNFAIVMGRNREKYKYIYEIGRQGGEYLQRKVDMNSGAPGEWERSRRWHEYWNPGE